MISQDFADVTDIGKAYGEAIFHVGSNEKISEILNIFKAYKNSVFEPRVTILVVRITARQRKEQHSHYQNRREL